MCSFDVEAFRRALGTLPLRSQEFWWTICRYPTPRDCRERIRTSSRRWDRLATIWRDDLMSMALQYDSDGGARLMGGSVTALMCGEKPTRSRPHR